jgi:biotin carboxyl carrier protein
VKLKITVHGVAYEVDVEVLDVGEGFPGASAPPLPRRAPPPTAGAPAAAQGAARALGSKPAGAAASPGGAVTSPIAGTVLEVKCKPGDRVEKNQELIVVEAMKMEASISAPAQGAIKSVDVAAGDAIREGQVVVQFE